MNDKCLRIWQFNDAPAKYRRMSRHGGDEDLILYCPEEAVATEFGVFSDIISGAFNYSKQFGHADRHQLADGSVVVIFAHA